MASPVDHQSKPGVAAVVATALVTYALAQTFRITSPNRNRRHASCYGCGLPLEVDFGHEVHQQSFYHGRSTIRYLCRVCFAPVKLAHEQTIAGVTPSWWGDLARTPRSTQERRAIPRPGAEEIDALIEERERERQP